MSNGGTLYACFYQYFDRRDFFSDLKEETLSPCLRNYGVLIQLSYVNYGKKEKKIIFFYPNTLASSSSNWVSFSFSPRLTQLYTLITILHIWVMLFLNLSTKGGTQGSQDFKVNTTKMLVLKGSYFISFTHEQVALQYSSLLAVKFSLDLVSVPVWLIVLSDQLKITGLVSF